MYYFQKELRALDSNALQKSLKIPVSPDPQPDLFPLLSGSGKTPFSVSVRQRESTLFRFCQAAGKHPFPFLSGSGKAPIHPLSDLPGISPSAAVRSAKKSPHMSCSHTFLPAFISFSAGPRNTLPEIRFSDVQPGVHLFLRLFPEFLHTG